MVRRGWWRAIPPELGIPIAVLCVLRAMTPLLLEWHSASLASAVTVPQLILVLCGLRELRRRHDGRTRTLLGVAAGVQTVAVALWAVTNLVLIVDRASWRSMVGVENLLVMGLGVVMTAVVVTAARAWNSLEGLGAVASSIFLAPAAVVAEMAPGWLTVGTNLVYLYTMLAVCSRLAVPSTDPAPGRAARAAWRAVWGWRIRVAMFALWLVVNLAWPDRSSLLAWILFDVATLILAASGALVVSGMLGIARGQVPGLPAYAFTFAMLATLVGTLAAPTFMIAALPRLGGHGVAYRELGDFWVMALLVVVTTWAAWQVRRYALRARDRARGSAVAVRFAGLVVAQLGLVTLVLLHHWIEAWWYPALVAGGEVVSSLALLGLYRILHERLALAEQIDAF